MLLSVPVGSEKTTYGPYDPGNPDAVLPQVEGQGFTEYVLPAGQVTRPMRMEVHEASDVRGETPVRICLLDSNRTTLRTYSLPS